MSQVHAANTALAGCLSSHGKMELRVISTLLVPYTVLCYDVTSWTAVYDRKRELLVRMLEECRR